MYGHTYAETKDIRELADELDALREQGTCSECMTRAYRGETPCCGGDDRPWTVGITETCHTLFETEDEDEAREYLNHLPDVETGRYYIEQVGPEECDFDWDDEDQARYDALLEFESDLGHELRYFGDNLEPTMILESTFDLYAEELASDLGYMSDERTSSWPFNHIDWDAAAAELKHDYSSYEFDGETWLIRSC